VLAFSGGPAPAPGLEAVAPPAEADRPNAAGDKAIPRVRLLARHAYGGAWCIENEALAKLSRPQQRAELLEADAAYLSECLGAA